MKIRFDFVTNSSSSSYVISRIDNKKLADLYKRVGLWGLVSGQKDTVIKQRFDSEQTDLMGPGGESISDWLCTVLPYYCFWDDRQKWKIDELIKLIRENKDEIDHNTRSAEFDTVVSITDGYGSGYYYEERKGGKIILTGFDEDTWDAKKQGCYIDEFIIGSQEDNRRKAKEINGTKEYEDPWFKKEDISGIFDSPEDFSFDGHVVCLTGDFDYGSKGKVSTYIESHGGTMSSSVTRKTTVVLMGNKGSDAWSHGNYGTKIEKAIERRNTRDDIIILKECEELFAD